MAEGSSDKTFYIVIFFFVGVFAHFIDGYLWGFDRSSIARSSATLVYYLVLGVLYTFLRDSNEPLVKRLAINMFLSFFLWLLPILLLWLVSFAPTQMKLQFATKITIVLILTPVWLWLAADLYAQVPPIQVLWTIYLFFWVGVIVASSIFAFQGKLTQIANPMKAPVSQAISLIIDWIKDLWDKSVSAMQQATKAMGNLFNQQIEQAVGDEYYVGAVEDNEEGPLGVFFTNTRLTEYQIYEGEEISAWVDIEAKTLDEPISIVLNCYAIDKDGVSYQGDMAPDSAGLTASIHVDSFAEDFLICKFGKSQLSPGSYELVINATFNFETWAYLRTYFMDMDRLQGDMKLIMDNNNIPEKRMILTDIYKIQDPNPIARYTSGPVGIGIETNSPPIGVSPDGSTKPLFGVTIENRWDGKIREITLLNLETVPGLTIDTSNCDHPTSGSGTKYSISNIKDEIEFYKSFRCRMRASHSILDETPVTIRNLKATAKYIYVIEDHLFFDVEEYEFGQI